MMKVVVTADPGPPIGSAELLNEFKHAILRLIADALVSLVSAQGCQGLGCHFVLSRHRPLMGRAA